MFREAIHVGHYFHLTYQNNLMGNQYRIARVSYFATTNPNCSRATRTSTRTRPHLRAPPYA
ncbi:hypothetical protein [Pseudidiomarina terrestris]|uniref:hypothetical protein n=1 Tax=Pseudidiomarina terrestris TaxID=2820060 RepID=UPI00264CA0BA|nr:hypothetical protein [Pseudidiomarina sp. 1ASP75-5]MDN7135371.1 hypothetical protein [Pseudidiomarina sp. 1ASP75-5]